MNATVTCLDIRRILGAEPQRRDPQLLEHMQGCAACAVFARELWVLDARLEQALKIDVPEELDARIVLDASLRQPRRSWRPWAAAAASALLTVAVAVVAYDHRHPQGEELASAVVGHIEDESDSIKPDRALIHDASLVQGVLDTVGAKLPGLSKISYAQVCLFRGERVAHLVFEGPNGPVTLILLPHIHVKTATPVNEDGFHGVIEPAGKGSIAIVTRSDAPMDPMAQELPAKVQWTL
jgi:hypothetical protein